MAKKSETGVSPAPNEDPVAFAREALFPQPATASARHAAKMAGIEPEHPEDRHPDPPQSAEVRQGRLKGVGGSMSDRFNTDILNTTKHALWDSSHLGDPDSFTWAALHGIAPQDELEGMLAAQMTAAHAASMECFRRAMIDGQTVESREMNLRHASKASKTYATLLEALDRRRGKGGKQTVVVEHVHRHVHVHESQNTIVDALPGGGGSQKKSGKPHAQRAIAHAVEPALWSEDAERVPMPRTGDVER